MSRSPRLVPVGIVRSPFKEPADLPPPAFAPPRFLASLKGEIHIAPRFEAGLEGLERFSHLIVLFHFHRSKGFSLKVTPPGEHRARGVFASRSPHRPNPIGMSVLRLIRRRGRVLEVAGLDLVDGTPVLDIKPYTTRDRRSRIRTGRSTETRRAGG